MAVHALVDVRAEDGLIRAGMVIEGILRAVTEVRALIVTGEDRSGREARWSRHFGLDKEEVHGLALIQAFNIPG